MDGPVGTSRSAGESNPLEMPLGITVWSSGKIHPKRQCQFAFASSRRCRIRIRMWRVESYGIYSASIQGRYCDLSVDLF